MITKREIFIFGIEVRFEKSKLSDKLTKWKKKKGTRNEQENVLCAMRQSEATAAESQ